MYGKIEVDRRRDGLELVCDGVTYPVYQGNEEQKQRAWAHKFWATLYLWQAESLARRLCKSVRLRWSEHPDSYIGGVFVSEHEGQGMTTWHYGDKKA
jgi:hypothetical protein